MRKLAFFLLAALAVSPLLTGCVGIPNPQTEWTTTEGPGDQPPVSNLQSTVDESLLAALLDVAPVPALHEEHASEHDAEHPEHAAPDAHTASHTRSRSSKSSHAR